MLFPSETFNGPGRYAMRKEREATERRAKTIAHLKQLRELLWIDEQKLQGCKPFNGPTNADPERFSQQPKTRLIDAALSDLGERP